MRLYSHFFHAAIALHMRRLIGARVAGILYAKAILRSWFLQAGPQRRSRHRAIERRAIRYAGHRGVH